MASRKEAKRVRCQAGHKVCRVCGDCHVCWNGQKRSCDDLVLFEEILSEADLDVVHLAYAEGEEADLAIDYLWSLVDRKKDLRRGHTQEKEQEQTMPATTKGEDGTFYFDSEIFDTEEVHFVHDNGTVGPGKWETKKGAQKVKWDKLIGKYVKVLYQASTGGHSSYVTPACKHPGDTEVVNIDGVSFRCGKGWDLKPGPVDLIIDLAGSQKLLSSFVSGLPRYAELNKLTWQGWPLVKLDWSDQTAPPVGLAFWLKFWELLPKPSKVVICCMGSHGRTGTCLGAFMIASGWATDGVEVIKAVRALHCKEAIETKAQVEYLVQLGDAMQALMTKKAEQAAAAAEVTTTH